jgi:valyl-tRNA synthetase
MGHALDNVLSDIICRYKRMSGFDVLWQPGTDHASIATQLLVERDLSKNGINPRTLSKAELTARAWKWKEEKGGEILRQLHILGITPAWSRTRFTMDEGLSRAVNKLFVKMYNEGLIYRARRLVNWCPKQQTTISDLEIETRDEKGKFYYFNYPLTDGGNIEVATTRPETLFGDQAVAVHPDNAKLKHLIGKTAIIPLTNIEIPVIADVHADPEKGTGAVKITPAHDLDDWQVGLRHNLAAVPILTPDAKMIDSDPVPEKYRGLDRYAARAAIVADMTAAGLITRIEDKVIPTPYSERGNCVVEYMVREEWFADAPKLAVAAMEAATSGDLKFLPEHRQNLYMSWLKEIREWSISRQLWWGHQIPAWYDEDGNVFVAETEEDAYEKLRAARADVDLGPAVKPRDDTAGKKLTRDESVLDTWFSSALWPFSTLGWPDKTPELAKYYPTDLLFTAADIIFFWVARMVMMGEYVMGQVPFRCVNFHGLIRDAKGQKMSKTKGNGTDPLEPIEKYGADALRYFCSTAPIGTDIRYSEDEVKRGGKLLTKLWNAAKFVLMQLEDWTPTAAPAPLAIEDKWLLSELNKTIASVRKNLDKYDTFNSRGAIDAFFFDIFCDQYLEFAKGRPAETRAAAQWTLWTALREIIGLYAPFVPFITEELYQKIYADEKQTLHLTDYPTARNEWNYDVAAIVPALEIIGKVRGLRSERKIGGGARLAKVIVPTGTDPALFDLIKSGARSAAVEIGKEIDIVVA